LEAIATVHGPIQHRLEWDSRFLPASGADDLEQFAVPSRATSGLVAALLGLTRLAPFRRVLEAFLSEKFLFPSRENERLAAVHTGQRLVLERHAESSLGKRSLSLHA
jgi:hypothetical protein